MLPAGSSAIACPLAQPLALLIPRAQVSWPFGPSLTTKASKIGPAVRTSGVPPVAKLTVPENVPTTAILFDESTATPPATS